MHSNCLPLCLYSGYNACVRIWETIWTWRRHKICFNMAGTAVFPPTLVFLRGKILNYSSSPANECLIIPSPVGKRFIFFRLSPLFAYYGVQSIPLQLGASLAASAQSTQQKKAIWEQKMESWVPLKCLHLKHLKVITSKVLTPAPRVRLQPNFCRSIFC